jgi:hypothetical protein
MDGEGMLVKVDACVICDSPIERLKQALVAPFIARRVWDREPFCVDLSRCVSCGFTFYNPRLTRDDADKLYANYRSAEYQQMRHATEPWYTEKFNASLPADDFYKLRREKLSAVLAQHIDLSRIKSVLDYGGDSGKLVQGLIPGAQAFVYDISGQPAVAGVTSVTNPDCGPDLIINSNVLEHVGFPRETMQEMVSIMPKHGLLFVEVPQESPFSRQILIRRVAQTGIVTLLRPKLARHVLRPASLYLMHEHINYFTEHSLRKLMNPIASGTYDLSGPLVWCIGTKPPSPRDGKEP